MAVSDAPSPGTGMWLGVAASVLAVHAGLVAVAWETGHSAHAPDQPARVIPVAVLSAATPPGTLSPSRPAATRAAVPPPTLPPLATSDPAPASELGTAPNEPMATQAVSALDPAPAASSSRDDAGPLAPAAEWPPTAMAELPSPQASPPAPPHNAPTPAPASGWQPPVSGVWDYDVTGQAKGLHYRASAHMAWQQDGDRYDARLELRILFLGGRTQHSQGRLGPNGLVPARFSDKARHERLLTFDWAQGQLLSPSRAVPLMAGTQDRLSLFLQLGWTLARLAAPPPLGQSWTLPVASAGASGGSIAPWTFTFAGAERLALPAGTLDTWKLSHQRPPPDGQRVELWFSPALHHLPVRIRIVLDNGDEVDQQLSGPRIR